MLRLLTLAILAAVGFWVAWPAYSGFQINRALQAGNAAALSGKIDFDSVRASLRPSVTAEAGKRVDEALARQGAGGLALAGDLKKQLLPKVVDGALVTLVTPENIIRVYREGDKAKDAIARIVGEQIGKSSGGLGAVLGGLSGGAGGGDAGKLGDLAKGLGGLGGGAGSAGGLDKLGGLFGGNKKSPVRDVTDEPAPPAPGAAPPAAKPPAQPPSYGPGNIKSFGFSGPFKMRAGVAKDSAATVADVTAELSFTGMDWKLTALEPRF